MVRQAKMKQLCGYNGKYRWTKRSKIKKVKTQIDLDTGQTKDTMSGN